MLALLAATLVLAADGGSSAPPRALQCLTKHYPVEPVRADGGWSMRLTDGTVHPFDDGREKSFDERLAAPDMEDTFAVPYRTGPIVPVTAENDDPGRIRFDPLFRATYGARAKEMDLVELRFLRQRLSVHRKVRPAFERVAARLERAVAADASLAPYLRKLGGTFHWRKIAGTERQSSHSYGVSIDLNVERAHYWEWQRPRRPIRWANQVPQAIVDAFEAEGFVWGGRWHHYDTMHFEYRPELLDPDCR